MNNHTNEYLEASQSIIVITLPLLLLLLVAVVVIVTEVDKLVTVVVALLQLQLLKFWRLFLILKTPLVVDSPRPPEIVQLVLILQTNYMLVTLLILLDKHQLLVRPRYL